jgi:hypothetical protein
VPGGRARIERISDPRAGQPAQPSDLVEVAALVTAYYTLAPDPAQQVTFGTSGHRGSSFGADSPAGCTAPPRAWLARRRWMS